MLSMANLWKSPRDLVVLSLAPTLGLLLALAAAPTWAAEPADAEPMTADAAATTPAADPAQIEELIRKLDDDRFAVREKAQQRLFALGNAALLDIGMAAANGSLECSTRAVSILLQWSQSQDHALSLGALETLAALTNRPAEAALAAERLADVRERAAMEALVSLGGRVEFDRQVPVMIDDNRSVQVIIGPNWTGGTLGLNHLNAIRTATTLSFYSSAIGGDEAAAALDKMPNLQRIEFYGTPVSESTQATLHNLMPHALVDVRGGARLGIAAGQLVPGGAQVGEVQPGTAAERAGLMLNDIITEFNGVAVSDFESLTREIAKAKPGDSVLLKVLRPNPIGQQVQQPLDVIVKFAEWNDQQAVNPKEGNPLSSSPLGSPARLIINR
jgi:hypothetical protein